MTGHRPFQELRDELYARSPGSRQRVEEILAALMKRNWKHWFQAPRWFARLLQVDQGCPCARCRQWWHT